MGHLHINGRRTIGIDVDVRKLARATERRVHDAVVAASIHQLPFRDSAFDVVVSTEVIEHLPRPDAEEAIKEMRRVARRKIILTTPNGEGEQPHDHDENIHQVHKSEWVPEDLQKRGFSVGGLGLAWAWRPGGMARRHGLAGIFGRLISLLSNPIVARRPHIAAGMLATLELDAEGRRRP